MDSFREYEAESKKNKGTGYYVAGLLLIVLAVLAFAYRNGAFDGIFSGKTTDGEFFAESVLEALTPVNNEIVRSFEKSSEEKTSEKVNITADWDLTGVVDNPLYAFFLGDLLKNKLSYEVLSDGSGISIKDTVTGETVYERELPENSGFENARNSKIASKYIKKYIEKYEGIFLHELVSKTEFTRDDNYINNLSNVILVETEMGFEFSDSDVERAMLACVYEAGKDRKLKKAYEAANESDDSYEEALEKIRISIVNREPEVFKIGKWSGKAYINVSEGLTMADITMVPSEKSVSESETEPAVRRIKVGYTYINKRAGFVYETYSNDVLQMSLSGGGNYNSKSVTLNALGDGYIRAASPLGGDVELKFKMSLQDLQMIRSDGTYFSGIIELEPEGDLIDKIQIDLRGANGVQEIKTLLGTKNGGRGSFDLVAEKR